MMTYDDPIWEQIEIRHAAAMERWRGFLAGIPDDKHLAYEYLINVLMQIDQDVIDAAVRALETRRQEPDDPTTAPGPSR